MIFRALLLGFFLAATACDSAPEATPDRTKTVAWSCESPRTISCREHDHAMYATQPAEDREASMKNAMANCVDAGDVVRRAPCPDRHRRLICHMTPFVRTMSGHPSWLTKTERQRLSWCPIGTIEDRFE